MNHYFLIKFGNKKYKMTKIHLFLHQHVILKQIPPYVSQHGRHCIIRFFLHCTGRISGSVDKIRRRYYKGMHAQVIQLRVKLPWVPRLISPASWVRTGGDMHSASLLNRNNEICVSVHRIEL